MAPEGGDESVTIDGNDRAEASPRDSWSPEPSTREAQPDSHDAAVEDASSDTFRPDVQHVDVELVEAADSGPGPIVWMGPGGTTIAATLLGADVDAGISLESNCADVPTGLFETLLGPCLRVTTNASLVGPAKVCFPNPTNDRDARILRCTAPLATASPSCTAPDKLFNGKCCLDLNLTVLPNDDPICGVTSQFGTIAMGVPVDSDQDFIPDFWDNCPTVWNFRQEDGDQDGVGDACDNCPYTFNADQMAMSDGGIGNACNCTLAAVPLGPDGCPCSRDGGASAVTEGGMDASNACGLLVAADGAVVDGK
jgi:hypothetical protein